MHIKPTTIGAWLVLLACVQVAAAGEAAVSHKASRSSDSGPVALQLAAAHTQGSEASESKTPEPAPAYSRDGADTCLKCHDEDSEFPVLALFKTRHGSRADERSPMAGLQCESCHGAGADHGKRLRRGEERPPIRNFGTRVNASAAEQNGVCLGCHEGKSRIPWASSAHGNGDVACASCHKVHAEHDPASSADQQLEVCGRCHARQRAAGFKASGHPLRQGEMACSGCHASHGSATPAMLRGTTLNDTCTQCHAEKRGPFLWEHAPVAEDCGLCHDAHGSNHPALLKRRAPQLCQQCHAQAGHPSVAFGSNQLPGASPSAFLLAGSCGNCHSQVHGSNHPSGVKLMR